MCPTNLKVSMLLPDGQGSQATNKRHNCVLGHFYMYVAPFDTFMMSYIIQTQIFSTLTKVNRHEVKK